MAYHCLWALGFQRGDARLLFHSVMSSAGWFFVTFGFQYP